MLEHVFGSKTRVRLMSLFVHHPEQVYYVRELTRIIDTQINAVRRELENLVEIGLIREGDSQEESKQKRPGLQRKYYTVNATFPLYPEVKALLTKAHVFCERKIDAKIDELGDVKYAAFLGVFLGQHSQPVDVFIVGNVSKERLSDLLRSLEQDLGIEINYSVLEPREFVFRRDMSDRFVTAVLEAPKIVRIDRLETL